MQEKTALTAPTRVKWEPGRACHAHDGNDGTEIYIHACLFVKRYNSATFHLHSYPLMARKTKEDTQATREGILDAAEACFHEHGVARTTLEMIGARAGYTRGAVYWHFKNKGEVLTAIVERVHLPFMQELERTSTDQRDTPVHDLRAVMIHSFIELSEDERLRKTMEIMLRSDASADTRVLTELQQSGFRDALDRMERALRRAQDLGQLRDGADPKIAARMLHATVLGVLHGAMVEPDLMDLKRDGMLALDMTLAAYVKEGVFVPGSLPEPLPEA